MTAGIKVQLLPYLAVGAACWLRCLFSLTWPLILPKTRLTSLQYCRLRAVFPEEKTEAPRSMSLQPRSDGQNNSQNWPRVKGRGNRFQLLIEEMCRMGGILMAITANNLPHSLRENILVRHNPRLSRMQVLYHFWISICFAYRSGHGLVLALEVQLFWEDSS